MQEPSMIFYLAMITLSAAVAFAVWQWWRAKRAQQNNEQTAFTDD